MKSCELKSDDSVSLIAGHLAKHNTALTPEVSVETLTVQVVKHTGLPMETVKGKITAIVAELEPLGLKLASYTPEAILPVAKNIVDELSNIGVKLCSIENSHTWPHVVKSHGLAVAEKGV